MKRRVPKITIPADKFRYSKVRDGVEEVEDLDITQPPPPPEPWCEYVDCSPPDDAPKQPKKKTSPLLRR